MTDDMHFETEMTRLFTALLDTPWQQKMVWEHIRDKEDPHALCATPAFAGSLYHEAKTKIMFVGRDLNGWLEPLGDCSTLVNTVHAVIHQNAERIMPTIVNSDGVAQEDGRRRYYHQHSKFLRFIKHVLEYCGESANGIDATWSSDPLQWHQRFVWANLFCIAPRNPNPAVGVSMHADAKLQRLGIQHYVELMRLYMDHYKPDAIVFITDLNWFIPWKRKVSFRDVITDYREAAQDGPIVATGRFGNSPVIVCKRPDRIGMSYQQVQDMARTIADHIRSNRIE